MLTDLSAMEKNIPSIVRVEVLSPASAQFGVGTIWRETRLMWGREETEEMSVVSHNPSDFEYTVEAESCGCRMRTTVQAVEVEDSAADFTRVVMTTHSVPLTCFAKVMVWLTGWLMNGLMRTCLEQDLQAQKHAIERRA